MLSARPADIVSGCRAGAGLIPGSMTGMPSWLCTIGCMAAWPLPDLVSGLGRHLRKLIRLFLVVGADHVGLIPSRRGLSPRLGVLCVLRSISCCGPGTGAPTRVLWSGLPRHGDLGGRGDRPGACATRRYHRTSVPCNGPGLCAQARAPRRGGHRMANATETWSTRHARSRRIWDDRSPEYRACRVSSGFCSKLHCVWNAEHLR